MAVANITEFSNSVNPTNVVADLFSPALVKKTCMLNLMHVEGLPEKTMTKLHPKKGTLTAASLAESTALAINSSGELTDTSVSSTIAKSAVSSGISVEELEFGYIDANRIAEEQSSAMARLLDNDALALLDGFSTVVTSSTILTVDDVMLGQYNIYNSECPEKEITLQAVLSHKGHYNIKKELIQSGASVWTNQTFLPLLQSTPQANCYVGSIPGIADFYATSGHATGGGDSKQGIFHPKWALFADVAPAPKFVINMRGAEGLYQEIVGYLFYAVGEWNDLCGTELDSDT